MTSISPANCYLSKHKNKVGDKIKYYKYIVSIHQSNSDCTVRPSSSSDWYLSSDLSLFTFVLKRCINTGVICKVHGYLHPFCQFLELSQLVVL